MKKEDYLKLLRENEVFKAVLSQATSDTERRAIKAYTEDFMVKFFNQVYEPVTQALEKEPEAIKNAYQEISSELITSGSAEG
jgi:hypothetical protein